jgi:hypothetical protein
MRQTETTITVSNLEEAMEQAMGIFEAPAESIVVTELEADTFRAELVDHDADVRVEISSDNTVAVVVDFIPPKEKGRHLNRDEFLTKIRQTGVEIEPEAQVVDRVLQDMADGQDVCGTIVARGIEPAAPLDGYIRPRGDWSFPVFPNDVIGRYVPPAPGTEGVTVTGEKLSIPDHKPEDISFPGDGGCRLEEESSQVIATTYGLVTVQQGQMRVQPLIAMDNDKMAVKATIHAQTFAHEPTTPALFHKVLKRMKVMVALREQALEQAVEQAAETDSPVENVVLCRGIPSQKGKDGYFQMEVPSSAHEADRGKETESGRIDYKARNRIRAVQAGDVLGRLMPPQTGAPGRDVLGNPIPASEGRPFKLVTGENVLVSEDGSEFRAATEGMVFFQGNTLKVTEIFQINGDVNLQVGNVELERGSVSITGSVLAGFRVEAPGNIEIRNVVEDAVLVAGGDVAVGCGITMQHQGSIQAGGSISAMYAQNASLRACNEVNIAHEISNCSVFAGQKVVATQGRGKIIGGVLRCGLEVRAREIGSPMGVETIILMGVNRSMETSLARKRELKQTLEKIYASLGKGDVRDILEKFPQEKRCAVAQILQTRLTCERELQEIRTHIAQEREDQRDMFEKVRVKALAVMHPDVIIKCFKGYFKTTKTLQAPTIVYNLAQGQLVLA